MTQYTVVFAMNNQDILLIRKAKPDWQKGLLNGIGGKREPGESLAQCAKREFVEETGCDQRLVPRNLVPFHSMMWPEYKTHTNWPQVWFYAFEMSSAAMAAIEEKTNGLEEPCYVYRVWDVMAHELGNMMPNIPFLVSMAQCMCMHGPEERLLRQPVVMGPIQFERFIEEDGAQEEFSRELWLKEKRL